MANLPRGRDAKLEALTPKMGVSGGSDTQVKMTKSMYGFTAILVLFVSISFIAPAYAIPSLEEKLDAVSLQTDQISPVDYNTMQMPLMSGNMSSNFRSISLFELPVSIGYKGEILFEEMPDKVMRVKYHALKEPAYLSWLFENPMDGRNRWFRVRYAGLATPSQVKLQFNMQHLHPTDGFDLFLKESSNLSETKISYFKLPNKKSFENISRLRLFLNPETLESKHADFVILGIDIMPESLDLLSAPLEGNRLKDFTYLTEALNPDNRVSPNPAPSI